MNITKMIQENIRATASRRNDEGIITAEGMIPRMDDKEYHRKRLDISYADRTPAEKLDIFYPEEGDGPFPVFVEVHGGAWYFGQKRSVEFEPFLYGLNRGYACVSLGYTLSPEGHYPLPVLEIKSAIRFLRVHAEEYKLDPSRIVLWGGSAGAHLAALAATSCDTGYLEDWIYENFFGTENLKDVEEALRQSSPLMHLTKDSCPTFLQHGRADQIVPFTQSTGYYERLCQVAGAEKGKLEILDNCDHADEKMFAKENIQKVFDFADQCLQKI